MIILITYEKFDFSIPVESLNNAIMGSSNGWWHHFSNVWIINTSLSMNQVHNNLIPNISTLDRIMLIEIKENYQGWLPQEAWDWLKSNFHSDKSALQKLFS